LKRNRSGKQRVSKLHLEATAGEKPRGGGGRKEGLKKRATGSEVLMSPRKSGRLKRE